MNLTSPVLLLAGLCFTACFNISSSELPEVTPTAEPDHKSYTKIHDALISLNLPDDTLRKVSGRCCHNSLEVLLVSNSDELTRQVQFYGNHSRNQDNDPLSRCLILSEKVYYQQNQQELLRDKGKQAVSVEFCGIHDLIVQGENRNESTSASFREPTPFPEVPVENMTPQGFPEMEDMTQIQVNKTPGQKKAGRYNRFLSQAYYIRSLSLKLNGVKVLVPDRGIVLSSNSQLQLRHSYLEGPIDVIIGSDSSSCELENSMIKSGYSAYRAWFNTNFTANHCTLLQSGAFQPVSLIWKTINPNTDQFTLTNSLLVATPNVTAYGIQFRVSPDSKEAAIPVTIQSVHFQGNQIIPVYLTEYPYPTVNSGYFLSFINSTGNVWQTPNSQYASNGCGVRQSLIRGRIEFQGGIECAFMEPESGPEPGNDEVAPPSGNDPDETEAPPPFFCLSLK